MYAVQEATLATGSNSYQLKIDGVSVTSCSVTVLVAGAEGDQYTASAAGANTFAEGNNIEIVPTVANTDASASVRFVIKLQRA
jgi:hypothetical protein